jgi:hypothetical protein
VAQRAPKLAAVRRGNSAPWTQVIVPVNTLAPPIGRTGPRIGHLAAHIHWHTHQKLQNTQKKKPSTPSKKKQRYSTTSRLYSHPATATQPLPPSHSHPATATYAMFICSRWRARIVFPVCGSTSTIVSCSSRSGRMRDELKWLLSQCHTCRTQAGCRCFSRFIASSQSPFRSFKSHSGQQFVIPVAFRSAICHPSQFVITVAFRSAICYFSQFVIPVNLSVPSGKQSLEITCEFDKKKGPPHKKPYSTQLEVARIRIEKVRLGQENRHAILRTRQIKHAAGAKKIPEKRSKKQQQQQQHQQQQKTMSVRYLKSCTLKKIG